MNDIEAKAALLTPLPTHQNPVSSPGFDSHTLSQAITNFLISQQAWQRLRAQPDLQGHCPAPAAGTQVRAAPAQKCAFIAPCTP